MAKALCVVINLTGKDIKFTEWRRGYVEELKLWARKPFHEKTIKSGDHYAFSASEFVEHWERIQKVVRKYPEWTVSLESEDLKGIPLPVSELKDNRAFVFEMGENNELVKLTVSREEAKRRGIEKGFFGSVEKMASQLVSLVNERKTASSSVRQDENM
ncbi:uncharacterized protein LOC113772077 [Coffea eugenioides]|uniref:uncharacterized protein LOC113772068 n=1 Tax=Coffea eugenioides TaxID=49369 RepID=UPI000F605C0E|nr:uncharacterized protein LOC113772068 [Coffea eugenioides]XP_027172410.1 uncharacterized protein LOC113772072 [Coffea eugenioides]XP_027172416.1 uncharacterized protein LOC113772077 [Coffea eugenioides]